MAGVITFLKTTRSKQELQTALDVLREFKALESKEEWFNISFTAWTKLEQFEEYLAFLVEGKLLNDDTLAELQKILLSQISEEPG